jgi:hypothetical protein
LGKGVTCQGEQMRGMGQHLKGRTPPCLSLLDPRTHHRVSSPVSPILSGYPGGSCETHSFAPFCSAKSGVFSDIGASFCELTAGSSISGFGGQSVVRLRPEALLACHDVVCGILGPASVAMTAKLLRGVLFKTHHRPQNISVRTMKRQWAKCNSVHKFCARAGRIDAKTNLPMTAKP